MDNTSAWIRARYRIHAGSGGGTTTAEGIGSVGGTPSSLSSWGVMRSGATWAFGGGELISICDASLTGAGSGDKTAMGFWYNGRSRIVDLGCTLSGTAFLFP